MKNYSKIFLGLIMVGLGLTSCQKEETLEVGDGFLATIVQESKTHLEGLNVKWDLNDEVAIFEGSQKGIYQVEEIVNNAASLQYVEGIHFYGPGDYNFVAIYPASQTTASSSSYNMPATQTYAANSVSLAPMLAQSNSNTLQFKNLCGVLQLHLKKSQGYVTRIVITCPNKKISGQLSIGSANGNKQVVAGSSSTQDAAENKIILDCGTGVNISNYTDFLIYLPVATYNNFKVLVEGRPTASSSATETFMTMDLKSSNSVTFNRNHIKKIDRILPSPNSTKGLFSIDGSHQVFIANGNLWNTVGPLNTNYNDHWIFAERPYDFIGTIADGTHQGKWNRFSWATTDDATLDGMSMYDHQVLNTLRGNFKDFGNHTISGDPAGTWFTLTENEWMYLLGMSSVNYNVSYNGGRLAAGKMYWDEPGDVAADKAFGYCYVIPEQGADYIVCKYNGRDVHVNRTFFTTNATTQNHTVNNKTIRVVHSGKVINGLGTNDEFAGIPCLVIYPDRFPKSKMLISEEYYYNNHAVAITDARYQELVELGCAFLPLLGQGQAQGQNANNEIRNVLTHGYYWTRTGEGQSAKCLVLSHQAPDITFRFDPDTRGNGNAVRLMQPAWDVAASTLYSGTRTRF